MQSAGWIRLLRQVPPIAQDGLMLQTNNRTEIAVQTILRFDADFLVIKGRLAGSQEGGRLFFVPYEQIDHVGFYRAVKDTEFNEMFAGLDTPAPEPTPSEANGSKTPAALKSSVLDRFRTRSSTTIMGPSPLAPRLGDGSNPGLPSNGQKTN